MEEKYRKALRGLMAAKGIPILFDEAEKERFPDCPDRWVSVFGWMDFDADRHGRACGWEVPSGVQLTEVSYSEFTDTDAPNHTSVGINVESIGSANIHCRCGEYSHMTLRWTGTLTEALESIFGPGKSQGVITL